MARAETRRSNPERRTARPSAGRFFEELTFFEGANRGSLDLTAAKAIRSSAAAALAHQQEPHGSDHTQQGENTEDRGQDEANIRDTTENVQQSQRALPRALDWTATSRLRCERRLRAIARWGAPSELLHAMSLLLSDLLSRAA